MEQVTCSSLPKEHKQLDELISIEGSLIDAVR